LRLLKFHPNPQKALPSKIQNAAAILPNDARAVPEPALEVPARQGGTASAGLAGGGLRTALPAGIAGAAGFPAQNAVFAGDLFRQLATALGLPADTLSVTLLAFSRFFSLPPKQALMETLRKEVLDSSRTASPQTAAEKSVLESKALAATAALDKGVTLSPEALERYARFFGPPTDGEGGGKGAFSGGGKGTTQDREEMPQKEELQAIAEEEAKEDHLLDVLNALPGKNGQYWAVFPFDINVRGTVLKVFLRILKGEPFLTGENEQIIIDIAGPKRQYRCFLKKTGGKLRADIRVYPELSPRTLKSLSKKAGHFLGEGAVLTGNTLDFEEITVRNGEGAPSWAEHWQAEPLPFIDKEV